MGLASEFSCRSSDNDQANPVECDTVSGKEGTSFASPAAAGAGAVVRDYFAQGFYPGWNIGQPGQRRRSRAEHLGRTGQGGVDLLRRVVAGNRPVSYQGLALAVTG